MPLVAEWGVDETLGDGKEGQKIGATVICAFIEASINDLAPHTTKKVTHREQ